MFKLMRERMKVVVIVVAVAFVATLFYAGGVSLFGGGGNTANAASVALVNGKGISYTDFYQAYYDIVRQQEMYGQPIRGQLVSQAQYYALDQLVTQELLLQAAEDAKLTVDESIVEERFEEIQSNFPSKAIFEQELMNSGLTSKELKKLIRANLKLEGLQEELLADVTVTDADIREAYEEVKARHILIEIDEVGENPKEEALAEAQRVMDAIREGVDFTAAAKSYSSDPGSASVGGDLGWFGRGRMVKPFEEAAFAAEIGDLVGPVESDFGFHIIEVTDRKEASGVEFDAVKEELKGELQASKEQELLVEWLTDLRNAAQIEIKDPALLAHKLTMEGQWDEAANAYEAAILANDSDPYLHSSLAVVFEQQGEPDKALAQYELAAEKAETDPELWLIVGMMHQDRDNKEAAVHAYKSASDADETNMMLHFQLMDAFYELGEEELADREEEKILEIQEMLEERERVAQEMQRLAEEAEQSNDDHGEDGDAEESSSDQSEPQNELNDVDDGGLEDVSADEAGPASGQ